MKKNIINLVDNIIYYYTLSFKLIKLEIVYNNNIQLFEFNFLIINIKLFSIILRYLVFLSIRVFQNLNLSKLSKFL